MNEVQINDLSCLLFSLSGFVDLFREREKEKEYTEPRVTELFVLFSYPWFC